MTSKYKISIGPTKAFSKLAHTPLSLTGHSITIENDGSHLQSRHKLTFFNSHSKRMQGELLFPLSSSARVCGYALENEDKVMVDAVPVEKEKAKIVFDKEVTSHSNDGVAVLEQSDASSNVYKLKIYPMEAKCEKKVRLDVIETLDLARGEKERKVFVPFDFSEKLKFVSIVIPKSVARVEVKCEKQNHSVEAAKLNFEFLSNLKKTDQIEGIMMFFKNEESMRNVYVEKDPENGEIFFSTTVAVPTEGGSFSEESKEKKSKVSVYWDISTSRGSQVGVKRELELLNSIVEQSGAKEVELVTFGHKEDSPVSFKDVSALEIHLKSLEYDGGTAFPESILTNEADFVLLFNDGIFNYGEEIKFEKLETFKSPVYAITGSKMANEQLLNMICAKSGGQFVNLNVRSTDDVLKVLKSPEMKLRNVDFDRKEVKEVFANADNPSEILVYGILIAEKSTLSVNFGKNTTVKVELDLTKAVVLNGIVRRLWGSEKIQFLESTNAEKNKAEIGELGVRFGIVTKGTALLVLNKLEQFKKYKICPPKSLKKLRKEYLNHVMVEEKQKEVERESLLKLVIQKFNGRKSWYQKEYKLFVPEPVPPPVKRPQVTGTNQQQRRPNVVSSSLNIQGSGSVVDDDMTAFVLDCGSTMVKAGKSGDDAPSHVYPTIVGRPKNPGVMVGANFRDCYCGDDALAMRGVLKLKYPIQRGMVVNWNDWEKILHHTFYNELRITPEEHPMILTEPALNPKNNREKMQSIMFETFNVPALKVKPSAELALYTSGKTTGVSVDCGGGVCQIVPIYEGYSLPHAICRQNIGGEDILKHLVGKFNTRSEFQTSAGYEIARDIKEKMCYVVSNYSEALQKTENFKEYELPDGSKINIGDKVRFGCPEILFNPMMIGSEFDGLSEAIDKSIKKCDIDIRKDLYANIELSGGSSMFPGFRERITKDLEKATPKNTVIKVNTRDEGKFAAWIGGSILSSLSTFQNMWLTKDEYDDAGATIVHRKCFGGGSYTPAPKKDLPPEPEKEDMSMSIAVNPWNPKNTYMVKISKAKDPFKEYLKEKKDNLNCPAFFLDVADYFFRTKKVEIGKRVLSNILELRLENVQLMRIVGYRLDQHGDFVGARQVFSRVKRIRPDEPQSWRDLALVCEKMKDYEIAVSYLMKVIEGKWESRFSEIELTAVVELNHVLFHSIKEKKFRDELIKKYSIPDELVFNCPMAVRVSMAWDTDKTDIDLHVYEPTGEHCFYSHNLTEMGGMLSRDFTSGYGPEEYMLRKVLRKGNFKISAKYFASHQQSLTGATVVLCSIFTNYMRENETSQLVTIRLEGNKEQIKVCDVKIV